MEVKRLSIDEKRVIWMSSIFSNEEYPFIRFYYLKDIIEAFEGNAFVTPCDVFTDLYQNRLISCHTSLFERYFKWDRSQMDDGYRAKPNDPMPDDLLMGKFHITTKGLALLKPLIIKEIPMANTDNECSGLNVNMEHAPDFTRVLEMQNELQEKIMPGFYDPKESLASIANFLMYNKHALDDEFSEAMDALGGIKDGVGSGVWKWWKKSHIQAETMTIADLSESDLKELKFEMVDQFFFFLNQLIKIGMTGDELYSLYKAKWQENMDRQNNNY